MAKSRNLRSKKAKARKGKARLWHAKISAEMKSAMDSEAGLKFVFLNMPEAANE